MTTTIEWTAVQGTDGEWHPGYTFNPWHGCVKISPACKNCYAEAVDRRFGGEHWGANALRRILSDGNWRNPSRWARKAKRLNARLRVFCGSMCDWLEDSRDPVVGMLREQLSAVITDTTALDWLMLSKRPENLPRMMPDWSRDGTPRNVWLGTTAETQEYADERIPHVGAVDTPVRFVSVEPMLGPVSLRHHDVDWVIIGSESGPRARETKPWWVRDLIAECRSLDRPVFLKQLPKHGGRRGQVESLPDFNGRVYREQPRRRA